MEFPVKINSLRAADRSNHKSWQLCFTFLIESMVLGTNEFDIIPIDSNRNFT